MDRRRFLQSSLAASVAAALPASQAFAALQALTQVTGDIRAVTNDRAEISIEKAAVQELADSLRGNLLLPGNDGYDVARRVLNPSIDKYPALIVQPTGVADIQQAVNFARDRQLLVAVKCGGHSYAGKSTCDGGLQLDLSTFRHCRVDRGSRRAYVAGGSLLGELDREAMAQGLVTTAGTVSHTGVGGLTTAGGFGRLGRRFGLALDNVKAVDVVTADGRLLHASAEENADLYWGVRGGGGNFGVVTSFEFGLHPMERTVVSGTVLFPDQDVHEVFKVYRDHGVTAPDMLYCDVMITSPMDGTARMAGYELCWSGPESEAESVLKPFLSIGEPVMNTVKAIDYVETQRTWDNTDPRNHAEYLKGGFINEFPDELIEAMLDGFEARDRRSLTVYLQQSGGAIGRVPVEATAFAHRKSIANMFAIVGWPNEDPAEQHVDYMREYWASLFPFTDGYYTVDTANESKEIRHGNYQGNFPRLLEVKKKYDPTNLFRLNANIAPA